MAWAIKVEAAGGRASIVRARTAPDSDIWIAGTYSGVGFLTNTMLAYSPSNVRALFVARLGPDGTVRMARGYPGIGLQEAFVNDLAVDPVSGDIVLAGYATGTLDLGGPQPIVSDAGGDFFVARLRHDDGSAVWSLMIPSTTDPGTTDSDSYVRAVIDGGTVFVVGSYRGSIDLGDGMVHPPAGWRMFRTWRELNTGMLQFLPRPDIIGDDRASIYVKDAAIDASHNIVVAGRFNGTWRLGQDRTAMGDDAFVVKFSRQGGSLWAVTGGGSGLDGAYGVAIGPGNAVSIVGYLTYGTVADSADFGGVAVDTTGGIGREAFTTRVTSDGVVDWARRFGGSGADIPRAVSITPSGDSVVAGEFSSATMMLDEYSLQANGTDPDAFVFVLSSSNHGHTLSADRFGSVNTDRAFGLAVDPLTENWLVAGFFLGVSRFGDKDLTTMYGGDAGFCARIVPGAR